MYFFGIFYVHDYNGLQYEHFEESDTKIKVFIWLLHRKVVLIKNTLLKGGMISIIAFAI